MGDRIIITTEGESLEIKIMAGIGVGHMKDRIVKRSFLRGCNPLHSSGQP